VRGEPALELLQSRRPDGTDLIEDLAWLGAALDRWGVSREVDRDELRHLRELMRALVEILDGGRLATDAELEPFNRFIARVPVLTRIERHGDGYILDMEPEATGGERALRELAGWFGSLLRADPWRLKLCANPECRLPFYDGSKSRTRIWHDNDTCGNRERVRRFRRRQASREGRSRP
jgi:predicted RNA-binding Zn ribbon-like protein